jgi:uncharacterized protein YfdQ (DUF2303 family)
MQPIQHRHPRTGLHTLATAAALLSLASTAQATCQSPGRSERVALVLCSPGTATAALKAAGQTACQGAAACNAWIWEDARQLPSQAPASDQALPKAQAGTARAVWISETQHLMELRKAR